MDWGVVALGLGIAAAACYVLWRMVRGSAGRADSGETSIAWASGVDDHAGYGPRDGDAGMESRHWSSGWSTASDSGGDGSDSAGSDSGGGSSD